MKASKERARAVVSLSWTDFQKLCVVSPLLEDFSDVDMLNSTVGSLSSSFLQRNVDIT